MFVSEGMIRLTKNSKIVLTHWDMESQEDFNWTARFKKDLWGKSLMSTGSLKLILWNETDMKWIEKQNKNSEQPKIK